MTAPKLRCSTPELARTHRIAALNKKILELIRKSCVNLSVGNMSLGENNDEP